ncbi:hypothetical protein GJAV_G00072480 [Gymnothorax javanicus]|nr:hypothetical protein GJAV_G00072480 [Gymnothorax javanicus]
MDRDLMRQSLSYHGQSLYSFLKCEQNENPDFKLIASDLSKAPNQRRDKTGDGTSVEQFIARKADLLFAHSWKSTEPAEDEWPEETEEPYAVMPPLDQFLDVPFHERRDLFYRDLERGDAVIGRISSIRDFGFFITLVCVGGGLERDIEDLELMALCPIRDVPSNGNHDDPLSYYQMGDLIRAGVKDIDRYHGKLTVSLHLSSLSPHLANLKLGVISKEDMPLHYIRGVKISSCSTETYESVLESSLGFSNPSNVEFLLRRLGVSETQPPSLMRGLQSKCFREDDYGTSIRKKQSASWALKCVKIGVDHFKSGRHVDAMNEYNKALEIDTNNVEALVARGALYATKGSLSKAMDDFELALQTCPTHRNAKKYLCQTLVERGGQLEEEDKLVTAEGLYKRALGLDSSFQEAEEALKKLEIRIQKSLKLKEEEMAKEDRKSKCVETSAEKLRKILKEEKRMKRKRKRSSSKTKKRRRKRRRSSHGRKKCRRRVSSREDRSPDGSDGCYPAPANTSASFLCHRREVAELLGERERSEDHAESHAKDRRSRPSVEDFRGRLEEDVFCSRAGGPDGDGGGVSPLGVRRVSGREREAVRGQWRAEDRGLSENSQRLDRPVKEHPSMGYGQRRSEGSRGDYAAGADRKPESVRISDRINPGLSSGAGGSRNVQGALGGKPDSIKDVPTNLLDIFSQIAEFEKEKGMKVKK